MQVVVAVLIGWLWSQVLGIFGGRITLHMSLCHKQFQLPVWLETICLTATTILFINSPIGWIASHRMHHDSPDTELDPHSPRHKGFLKVMTTTWTIDSIPRKQCKDLFVNPRLKFFHRYWRQSGFVIWVVCAIISPLLLLSVCVVPFIMSRIAYGLLNTVGHTDEGGSNIRWLDWFTVCEGYHLQHHVDPTQIRLHEKDYVGIMTERLFT